MHCLNLIYSSNTVNKPVMNKSNKNTIVLWLVDNIIICIILNTLKYTETCSQKHVNTFKALFAYLFM